MDFLKDLSIDKVRNLAEDAFNQAKPKTEVEARVYEVLSHKNWGASASLMNEVARDSFDYDKFTVVTQIMWESLENQRPAAWRVIFKGLTLLEHLIKNGSERCVDDARNHGHTLRALNQFNYYEGTVDRGAGVREMSKKIIELLADDERIREERMKARKLREKFGGNLGGVEGGGGKYAGYGNDSGWSSGGGGGGGNSGGYGDRGGGYGDGGIGSEKSRSKVSDRGFAGRYDEETSRPSPASHAPAPTFASIPDDTPKKSKSKKKKKEEAVAPAPAPVVDLFSFDDTPAPAPTAPAAADDFADFQSATPASAAPAHDPFATPPSSFTQQSQPADEFGSFASASAPSGPASFGAFGVQQQPQASFNAFGGMGRGNMNGFQTAAGVQAPAPAAADDDDDFGDFAGASKSEPVAATTTYNPSDPFSKLVNLDGLSISSNKKKPDNTGRLHDPVIASPAAATYVHERGQISQQMQQAKKGNMNSFEGLDGLGKNYSSTPSMPIGMGMSMSPPAGGFNVNPNIMASNASGADAISQLDPKLMIPPKPQPQQQQTSQKGMQMNPQMMMMMQQNPQMMQQMMMMMQQQQRMGMQQQVGGGGMPNMNPQQMQQMMMMMQQQQQQQQQGGGMGGMGGFR